MIVLNFVFIITGLILCVLHFKFRNIYDVLSVIVGTLSIVFNGASVLKYFNFLL